MTNNKNRQWILNVPPAGRLTGEEFRWNETSIHSPPMGRCRSGTFALKLTADRQWDNVYLVLRNVIRNSMSGDFLCRLL
jgi:hypothetical protein